MTKVCPVCGKEFDAKPCGGGRPQRYCSTHCRNVYHCRAYATRRRGDVVGPDGRAAGRVPIAKRTCPVCGRVFEPNPSRPKQKYCSLQCTKKAWADTLKAARLAARKDRVCPVCGVTFTPKHSQGVYCSKDCYRKAHWLQHKLPETVKCEHCGKEFTPNTSRARYCSLQCRRSVEHEKTKAAKLAARANRVCPVCGATFTPKSGKGIYCSRYCKSHARGRHILQPSVPFDIRLMEQHVREYLSLPDAERYQRRGTLTPAELKMAEKMWNQMHGLRMV